MTCLYLITRHEFMDRMFGADGTWQIEQLHGEAGGIEMIDVMWVVGGIISGYLLDPYINDT